MAERFEERIVAVIVAVPGLSPIIIPIGFTQATEGLLLSKIGSSVEVEGLIMVSALKLCPTFICTFFLANLIETASGVTVMRHFKITDFFFSRCMVAVIFAVPIPRARTTARFVLEATLSIETNEGFDDVKTAVSFFFIL